MKWRGKLNLKTGEKSWHTVLCCSQSNKVSCRNHSSTPGISIHAFQKEAKQKQIWTTFTRIHMHRLAWNRNTALCSEHFKSSYFSRRVLIGTPVDFKRFYLEEGSVPSIYTKPKDSMDIDYSRNEGRLANRFFSRETFFGCFFGTLPRNVSIQNPTPPPQKKKIDFFSDWASLFEICFRSSEMTDPRPCPRGWAYFKVPSCSTETCQAQTNSY